MKFKSLSDEYRNYLVKKKLSKKNEINKNKDIEQTIVESIIEIFKKNQTHQLGKFGMLRKSRKMIDSKMENIIEFVPNEDYMLKAAKRFQFYQKNKKLKVRSNLFILLIALLVFLLLAGGTASFFVFRTQINGFIASVKDKYESDKLAKMNSTTTSEMTDTSSDNAYIKKEEINYSDKEVSTNEDKSLIIKTQAFNDTDLQQGELRTSVVEIDGKLYDKNLYIIKKGDTLWDLADRFLFDPFLWPSIHKDNPYILNPDLIYPNYKLIIYRLKK